jgi:hypothetical protein
VIGEQKASLQFSASVQATAARRKIKPTSD